MSTQDNKTQNYGARQEETIDVRNSQRDLLFSLDLGVTDLAVIEDISEVMIQEKVDVVKSRSHSNCGDTDSFSCIRSLEERR